MRCDADDLYPKDRIAWQVRWLIEHPEYDAVCGAFSIIDSKGNLVTDLQCGAHPADITDELRGGRTRTSLCTYAMRSSLIARAGAFREFFETGEDIDFQLRIGEAGRIAYIPVQSYFYRVHNGSITHTQGTVEREFFQRAARDLQIQRQERGEDDLQMDFPRLKPTGGHSRAQSANEHVQGILVGRAWREHRAGEKATAIRTGFRALRAAPFKPQAWKNMIFLILKSPPR
jgi:hypothetical protein